MKNTFEAGRWCVVWSLVLVWQGSAAWAFNFNDSSRWSSTALSGSGLRQGDPTTITWGLVADGTNISGDEGSSPSSLIAVLDARYPNGGTGSDLTNREWFPLFEQAFDRWSQISGLTYVYEPNNSSSAIDRTTTPRGSAGSVPDVRIGGHSIDGSSGTNTLAYNYYPTHGDMVIDTDNASFLGNKSNNSIRLRNLLMHEHGHGLGFGHSDMPSQTLMHGTLSTSFDGPQLDEILAVQRGYGDAWEKNGGNNTAATAVHLGTLDYGNSFSIGTLGDSVSVAPTHVDFISIDDDSDVDYFSVYVPPAALLSVDLVPRGATYNIGGTSFNAKSLSDLSFRVYGTDGATELAAVNNFGIGQGESLAGLLLEEEGLYYVRVAGAHNNVQLYGLTVSAIRKPFLAGDVNLDGMVSTGTGDPLTDDVAAFVAGWMSVLPTDDPETAWRKGDLDLNGVSDLRDVALFRHALLGAGLYAGSSLHAVPEPGSMAVVGLCVGMAWMWQRRSFQRAP